MINTNLQVILNDIKSIIFLDFSDLQVYSKQSYRTVISKAFNNTQNSSYLYFDVDRLGILNETYGFEFGDMALANLLNVIKKSLPHNAVFCRIAGDEFCIIFPDTSEEECKKIEQEINKSIEKFSAFVSGLTITSSITSAVTPTTIEDLEHEAERNCSIKKEIKHQSETNINVIPNPLILKTFDDKDNNGNNVWEILNNSIINATNSHLQDLRFHKNYEFNGSVIKQEAFSIVSLLSHYLEEDEQLEINTTNVDDDIPICSDILSNESAQLIFKLLHSSSPQSIIEDLPDEELFTLKNALSHLLEQFIRDPLSGLFTKSYLKTFLADKICSSNTKYQAIYLSNNGVKQSNTAYGHSYTDLRLYKTFKKIQEVFSKKRRFNKNAFSFSEDDCHFIDNGGGDYVLLIPENRTMSEEEISELVTQINADTDIQATSSSFLVSSSVINNIDKTNVDKLLTTINNLKEATNSDKVNLKMQLLSGIDNFNSLKVALYNCTQYYKQNVKDPDNIIKKNAFLTNIFSSFVSHQAIHNEKRNKDKEKEYSL